MLSVVLWLWIGLNEKDEGSNPVESKPLGRNINSSLYYPRWGISPNVSVRNMDRQRKSRPTRGTGPPSEAGSGDQTRSASLTLNLISLCSFLTCQITTTQIKFSEE
jgi:hypothetical protein